MKTLHRIYFGFDGKPDPYLKYLNTWSEQLPDFKIIHWNADNLPVMLNSYTKKMYKNKNHAFLSDYFRWWILHEYGGIYLDADIEVLNGAAFSQIVSSVEDNESLDGFIGIDNMEGGWYTAHSMGAKKGSIFSAEMLKIYDSLELFVPWMDKNVYLFAPCLVGLFFSNQNHNVGAMGSTPWLSQPVDVARVRIFPQEYFSPITPVVNQGVGSFIVNAYTTNSCLCHHFSGSWHDDTSIYSDTLRKNTEHGALLLEEAIDNKSIKVSSNPVAFSRFGRLLDLIRTRLPQAVNEIKKVMREDGK